MDELEKKIGEINPTDPKRLEYEMSYTHLASSELH